MYYSKEETRRLLVHHIKRIAQNWTSDDYIMGYFSSGNKTLIDFEEHRIANFPYRADGYCRATVEELKTILDFDEIPNIVRDAMNEVLGGKITSTVVCHTFDGKRYYVRLDISNEEASRRFRKWQVSYKSSRRKMGF